MLSANNLLRPQDGEPVTVPTQDMVLGSYYLTYRPAWQGGEGRGDGLCGRIAGENGSARRRGG